MVLGLTRAAPAGGARPVAGSGRGPWAGVPSAAGAGVSAGELMQRHPGMLEFT